MTNNKHIKEVCFNFAFLLRETEMVPQTKKMKQVRNVFLTYVNTLKNYPVSLVAQIYYDANFHCTSMHT